MTLDQSPEKIRRLLLRGQAWFWRGGICKECAFPVVVTGSHRPTDDYQWYCSNPDCSHHSVPEHTGDQEVPTWATEDEL